MSKPVITGATAMPFGKWMGTPLRDVPPEYLSWAAGQALTARHYPALVAWIKPMLAARAAEQARAAREWTERLKKSQTNRGAWRPRREVHHE